MKIYVWLWNKSNIYLNNMGQIQIKVEIISKTMLLKGVNKKISYFLNKLLLLLIKWILEPK